MRLNHGLHLAYCTNIHRGRNWAETLQSLETHTLAVRDRVSPGRPYAIGLRLSAQAARDLSDPPTLLEFQRWLDRENCYVFTINGFPYGQFHGTRVKEQVYAPDWTSPERLAFTNLLFDLLAELTPGGIGGSVSTVPCSFKEFIREPAQEKAMRDHLWRCVEHVAALSERTGRDLHLGLEPEPLCYLETSAETIRFFDQMHAEHPGDARLHRHLGVNYDTCHLAVEFEEARDALQALERHGIRISKAHLSSALKLRPTREARHTLESFADDIYFHQVIERTPGGDLVRYRDLDVALAETRDRDLEGREWRIHFHVPLQSDPGHTFANTSDHIEGLLDWLQERPERCHHLEMETYTWEVLPEGLKNRSVEDQLVSEYEWTLARLRARHLAPGQGRTA